MDDDGFGSGIDETERGRILFDGLAGFMKLFTTAATATCWASLQWEMRASNWKPDEGLISILLLLLSF